MFWKWIWPVLTYCTFNIIFFVLENNCITCSVDKNQTIMKVIKSNALEKYEILWISAQGFSGWIWVMYSCPVFNCTEDVDRCKPDKLSPITHLLIICVESGSWLHTTIQIVLVNLYFLFHYISEECIVLLFTHYWTAIVISHFAIVRFHIQNKWSFCKLWCIGIDKSAWQYKSSDNQLHLDYMNIINLLTCLRF